MSGTQIPFVPLRNTPTPCPPATSTDITIYLYFSPDTERVIVDFCGKTIFRGPSVLMLVSDYKELLPQLQCVATLQAQRLSDLVSVAAGVLGNHVPGSKVNREWGMSREQFCAAIESLPTDTFTITEIEGGFLLVSIEY